MCVLYNIRVPVPFPPDTNYIAKRVRFQRPGHQHRNLERSVAVYVIVRVCIDDSRLGVSISSWVSLILVAYSVQGVHVRSEPH